MTEKKSKIEVITERQFDIILRAGMKNDRKDIRDIQDHLDELIELYYLKEAESLYGDGYIKYFSDEEGNISYKRINRKCGFR